MKIELEEDETLTQALQRLAKKVGHFAFAKHMFNQGYQFRYTYFCIFGKVPKENKRGLV